MPQSVKVIVIRTAGTNCNEETAFAFSRLGAHVEQVHVNVLVSGAKKLSDYHIIALPGGFSYGDYLRTGAIARFSPAMEAVRKHAAEGRNVIGICNGFQILLEAGLLPGAMLRNKTLSFICKYTTIRCENNTSVFTCQITRRRAYSREQISPLEHLHF